MTVLAWLRALVLFGRTLVYQMQPDIALPSLPWLDMLVSHRHPAIALWVANFTRAWHIAAWFAFGGTR